MSIFTHFDLSGRHAVVTGGASGLGAAISEGLAEAGANIVLIDVDHAVFGSAQDLSSRGFTASAIQCDVRERDDLRLAYAQALDNTGGHIDILVNSAGIQRRHSSEVFPEEDWDAVLAINLSATFFFCQLAAQTMLKHRSRGKIINISSIMSNFGGITIPAYSASKGAVSQLTKAFSNDLAPKGICVNAIAPGYMDTALNAALKADPARTAEVLSRIPVGRWGQGSDVKGLAVFLASPASDYISGAVIPVDGGYSAR